MSICFENLTKNEGIKKSRPCEVACFFRNNVFVFVWFEVFDFADYIFVFVGGKIYSLVCITAIINAILFVHIFYSCVQFYLSYPHTPLLRIPLLLSVVEMK